VTRPTRNTANQAFLLESVRRHWAKRPGALWPTSKEGAAVRKVKRARIRKMPADKLAIYCIGLNSVRPIQMRSGEMTRRKRPPGKGRRDSRTPGNAAGGYPHHCLLEKRERSGESNEPKLHGKYLRKTEKGVDFLSGQIRKKTKNPPNPCVEQEGESTWVSSECAFKGGTEEGIGGRHDSRESKRRGRGNPEGPLLPSC